MANKLPTLRLTVSSYERLIEAHAETLGTANPIPRDARQYDHFRRGDEIVPRDQAEHDRLIRLGAAEDLDAPKRRHRAQVDRVETQREQLEQERKRLEDESRQLDAA